jgi:hypothetical protein
MGKSPACGKRRTMIPGGVFFGMGVPFPDRFVDCCLSKLRCYRRKVNYLGLRIHRKGAKNANERKEEKIYRALARSAGPGSNIKTHFSGPYFARLVL